MVNITEESSYNSLVFVRHEFRKNTTFEEKKQELRDLCANIICQQLITVDDNYKSQICSAIREINLKVKPLLMFFCHSMERDHPEEKALYVYEIRDITMNLINYIQSLEHGNKIEDFRIDYYTTAKQSLLALRYDLLNMYNKMCDSYKTLSVDILIGCMEFKKDQS